jgi:hypothetical protein
MPYETNWRRVLYFIVFGFVAGLLLGELTTFWKEPGIFAGPLVLASPGIWLFAHWPWTGSRFVFSYAILPTANGVLYAAVGGFLALLTSIRNR